MRQRTDEIKQKHLKLDDSEKEESAEVNNNLELTSHKRVKSDGSEFNANEVQTSSLARGSVYMKRTFKKSVTRRTLRTYYNKLSEIAINYIHETMQQVNTYQSMTPSATLESLFNRMGLLSKQVYQQKLKGFNKLTFFNNKHVPPKELIIQKRKVNFVEKSHSTKRVKILETNFSKTEAKPKISKLKKLHERIPVYC